MEERIVEIKDKKVKITEIKFIDTFKLEISEMIQRLGYAPTMLVISTDLTEEEVMNLSKKDGFKLWKVYQELNEDFLGSETEVKE